LRSFSHELVHHAQNCSGQLDNLSAEGHYAEGGLGRKIERDAYDRGNMNLRDWEDGLKHKREGVNQMNEHYQIAKEEFKKLVASVVEEVVSEKKKESLKEANCEEVIKKVNDLERQANDNFRASRGNDMEHAVGSELEAEARDLREKHKNCFPQAEEPAGQGLPQGRELTFRDLDEGSKKKGKQVVTETPQQPKEVKETNKAWYDTSLYTKLKSRWTKKGDK
jgi:5'-3' exonuclease